MCRPCQYQSHDIRATQGQSPRARVPKNKEPAQSFVATDSPSRDSGRLHRTRTQADSSRLGGSRRCKSNRECWDRVASFANMASAFLLFRNAGQIRKLAVECSMVDPSAQNV